MTHHKPPVPTTGDQLSAAARDLIGLIPGVGAPARLLIDRVLPEAIHDRQLRWMEQVGETIDRLDSRQIDIHLLARDEGFIDILLQATLAALRTRHVEKRRSLSSTVAHAAIAVQPDRDEELLFIRYVDELSPSHLYLLRYLVTHEASIRDAGSYQNLLEGYQSYVVRAHAPPPDAGFFRLMCSDLMVRGLFRASRNLDEFPGLRDDAVIVDGASDPDAPTVLVTELGHRLARYIEDPS